MVGSKYKVSREARLARCMCAMPAFCTHSAVEHTNMLMI